jgi:hypothetical protein
MSDIARPGARPDHARPRAGARRRRRRTDHRPPRLALDRRRPVAGGGPGVLHDRPGRDQPRRRLVPGAGRLATATTTRPAGGRRPRARPPPRRLPPRDRLRAPARATSPRLAGPPLGLRHPCRGGATRRADESPRRRHRRGRRKLLLRGALPPRCTPTSGSTRSPPAGRARSRDYGEALAAELPEALWLFEPIEGEEEALAEGLLARRSVRCWGSGWRSSARCSRAADIGDVVPTVVPSRTTARGAARATHGGLHPRRLARDDRPATATTREQGVRHRPAHGRWRGHRRARPRRPPQPADSR